MNNKKILLILVLAMLPVLSAASNVKKDKGLALFKTYCWGCHHQTAVAFGPSFESIANKRNKGQIIAQIINPEKNYKNLGYRINSMPSFSDLNSTQINELVKFIYKFKDKK